MKDPFSEFLPYSGKANFEGVNPQFMDNFQQMANEYMTQTGKQLTVNDAFRTRETQAKAYKEKPNLAAPPGHSWHERGMAMDIDETQANELAKLKDESGVDLLSKYGFHRPMMTKAPGKKYEPWHIQWAPFEPKASKIAATVDPFAEFVTPPQKAGATQEDPFAGMAQPTPEKQPSAMGGFKEGPVSPPPQTEGITPGDFTRAPAPGEVEALKQRVLNPPPISEDIAQAVGPTLRFGGAAAGTALGTLAAGPAGAVAGGTLGYGIGRQAENLYEQSRGQRVPGTIPEEMKGVAAEDLPAGAQMALAGEIGGPLLQKGLGTAGKIIRPAMGKLSGVGESAIETALKGGTNFVRAMRGKISGEEVVGTAQEALQSLRAQRASAYQAELAKISRVNQDLDMGPINSKLRDLMKQFNIKVTPEGTLDTSRIAMGKKGRQDVENIVETVWEWGSKPGDKTAVGLDTLKRQLDDFYSESSQARSFVANLRKQVKKTITDNVPEYAEMTKGYAEATQLIKDIESGLMMRKQGMTGRITADQTLRRLVSAMRDNFPLRRDLVNQLGAGSGEDIAGLVAGHSMSAILPRGMAGTFMIPEAMLAQFVNPKLWPILVASSPRLQGEFLNLVGKGIQETSGVSVPLAKSFTYMVSERKRRDREPKTYKPGDPEIYEK